MEISLLNEPDLVLKNQKKLEAFDIPGCYLAEEPEAVYKEQSVNVMHFNIMPDAFVTEKLYIKEYRIWDHYIEGIFDREYISQMRKSPDHLIFLSALIHLQKLFYVYTVHKLGFTYDPKGPELVKFWPTEIQISIPNLTRKRENLVQKVFFDKIVKKANSGGYEMHIFSKVGDNLTISGKCPFFILGNQ